VPAATSRPRQDFPCRVPSSAPTHESPTPPSFPVPARAHDAHLRRPSPRLEVGHTAHAIAEGSFLFSISHRSASPSRASSPLLLPLQAPPAAYLVHRRAPRSDRQAGALALVPSRCDFCGVLNSGQIHGEMVVQSNLWRHGLIWEFI
jgi:hypothetical protein